MESSEYNSRLVNAADRLRKAHLEYETRIRDHVTAERLYKLGESIALLQVDGKNQQERSARAEVELVTLTDLEEKVMPNQLRYAAHLAEGLRDSAKKAVDSYRQEMSALQSLASLAKSEAELAKWEPRESAPV